MASKTVFMIISHMTRLAKGVKSNEKGVSKNPDNYEIAESLVIADRVSTKQMIEASIVIDLLDGKVLKSRFDVPNQQLYAEYVDRYKAEVTDALKNWIVKNPENFLKLKELGKIAGEPDDSSSTD